MGVNPHGKVALIGSILTIVGRYPRFEMRPDKQPLTMGDLSPKATPISGGLLFA